MNYVLNFTLRSLKAKWSVMKSHFSTASSVREHCISMRVYGSQQTMNWFWNWFKKCIYSHQVNIRASIRQWSWLSITITGQACREQWTSTFRIAMSASGQSLQRIKRMNCSILFQFLNSVESISRWISSQDYLQQRMKRMQYLMSWTVYQKNIITSLVLLMIMVQWLKKPWRCWFIEYIDCTACQLSLSLTEDLNLSQQCENHSANTWEYRSTYQLHFTPKQIVRLNEWTRMLRPSYKHTPMRARMIRTHGCQWLNLQITTQTLQQSHCLPSSWTMDFTREWALNRIQHHMKRLSNVYRHEVLGNWPWRWMRYLHSQSNILQRLRKQCWDR